MILKSDFEFELHIVILRNAHKIWMYGQNYECENQDP